MEVSCIKLLKTNVEKMSVFRLSTMLMKTKEVIENESDKWRVTRHRVRSPRSEVGGLKNSDEWQVVSVENQAK